MIIAIDPGKLGGFAIYQGNYTYCFKMPDSESGVIALITELSKTADMEGEPMHAIMEDQTGCVGTKQSAPSMFKFGRGFGFLLGVLQSKGWRVELVKPQAWIKVLALGTKEGLTGTQWKNKLKDMAQRLNPDINVTLYVSDALLILEYHRRTHLV
jgi:hypothetical protein